MEFEQGLMILKLNDRIKINYKTDKQQLNNDNNDL